MVLYYHPSVFDKSLVPTNMGDEYMAIAALYATRGYAVLMPDGIGLGRDYQRVHPYILTPLPNVANGYYGLAEVARKVRNIFGTKSQIPLFVAGYSEGASYAVWFYRCKRVGACEGVNNLILQEYS